ncbi:MAG: ABC transporter ATP-binding protein [Spirochaetota bacterium]|nr:ABC transporter ATP-binding protein [Spirochaetota bacterium]
MPEKQNKIPFVEMRGITKRFLNNIANNNIDLILNEGEICSILGENGAGKTTLMNILFGYYTADEGAIFIGGQEKNFQSPKDAIDNGIGMIHQHFTLVPNHTVLENIIIGTKDSRKVFLETRDSRKHLADIMDRFGLHVDMDAYVWTLSIGEQQKVEILKALYRNSRVLIMDEPTAVLAPSETPELFKTLKALAREGRTIIFISHKLNEVMEISDRVVVLRNGKVVNEKRTADTNVRDLATMMVGREVLERISRKDIAPGNEVLRVENLQVRNDKDLIAVNNLSFRVCQHEILGIAGVSGNGQTELCEALFGMRRPESGTFLIKDEIIETANPYASIEAGMARIPEDRIGMGLLMDVSVEGNTILENHHRAPLSKHGLLNAPAIAEHAETLIRNYSIKTDGRMIATKCLSGGNLQKVILARELSGKPDLVIASQPTRGLDVGAMEFIHERLMEEKERGAAIVLISDDLDEILQLSDRVVVIYEGEFMGEQAGNAIDREQIGLWMSGVSET